MAPLQPPVPTDPVGPLLSPSDKPPVFESGLLEALHHAFINHHGFVMSPDIIHQSVVLGLGQHWQHGRTKNATKMAPKPWSVMDQEVKEQCDGNDDHDAAGMSHDDAGHRTGTDKDKEPLIVLHDDDFDDDFDKPDDLKDDDLDDDDEDDDDYGDEPADDDDSEED